MNYGERRRSLAAPRPNCKKRESAQVVAGCESEVCQSGSGPFQLPLRDWSLCLQAQEASLPEACKGLNARKIQTKGIGWMQHRFQEVDVFGATPLSGNPLAVVHDAEGVSDEKMQQFARWANFSESTFLLPPTSAEADYRVRIFTLARELPFAGHPTLGSCHAWLRAGGKPKRDDLIIQECAAGLIPVRRAEDGSLAFAAPPLQRSGPVDETFVDTVARVLRIERSHIVDSQWVDNGPGWVAMLLPDAESVLRLEPDPGGFSGDGSLDIGVVGPYPDGSESAYEVRAFFSDEQGGFREDPVTGSLNASLAQWLLSSGRVRAPYIASQGTQLGRAGRPRIDQDDDGTIWVGGNTFTIVDGTVTL
jgi:PhzF family phenazine biosynthesis protein